MKQKKSSIFFYIGILAPFWMAFLFFILHKIGIYTIIKNYWNKLNEYANNSTESIINFIENKLINFWNGPYREPILIGIGIGYAIFCITILTSDLNDEKDDN